MEPNGIITLTTDFGTKDPYAGMMKGIMLGANPQARIVDITHDIPPHDILNGAFALARSYRFFPPGTVHVAVVDPGVGGQRKSIAVRTDEYFFIGPDNGVLSLVLDDADSREIRVIEYEPFVLPDISTTFHGRDVFAPCAGQLSAGSAFPDVGPRRHRHRTVTFPAPVEDGEVLTGEIVTIDAFGNLITSIRRDKFDTFIGSGTVEILFGADRFGTIGKSYTDGIRNEPLALFGSSGYLELSVCEGSAASYYMVSASGEPVSVRRL
jgi:S-adenosyl-L-methionine hydrolase (adenosine-forming)